ncbi:MAG: glycosyltransferase, partial [Bifidobacteriaceae bacterium]|nr:glycosyltransferase [Bifidobacteriaceae bacterium]
MGFPRVAAHPPGEPVTDSPPAPLVTAVVVTQGRSEYLPKALVALAAQTRPPESVVVVDAGAQSDQAIAEMAIRCGIPKSILTVVHAVRARNFGQAVAAGLAGRPVGEYIWLLHDDSYAAPQALAHLVSALEMAPSVGVAGPKQLQAADPARLGEVGVRTTPWGRRVPYGHDGELDQGQYDGLDDVLGVGSAGMLVRGEVWRVLGGLCPALGPFRDGLDFSKRARLAGFRVVVQPLAHLEHEQASYRGLRSGRRQADGAEPAPTARSFGGRRRALVFTRLVDCAWWAWPFLALITVLAGLGRFVWRLARKEFRLAGDEIAAPLAVLARPDSMTRARYVAARTRRVPRRALTPLLISAGEARAARRDRRITQAELRRQALAPTEIEIAEHRELASRRRRMAAGVFVLATAVSVAALYRLFGPGYIAGGAVRLEDLGVVELARIASGGWLTTGLGEAGPGDPFTAVLALLTLICFGDGWAAVKLLLLAAPLIGTVGAWFAAGAAARSVWVRAWAALFYLAAPAMWSGLSSGRLGATFSYAVLPWLALALARAVGANRLDV